MISKKIGKITDYVEPVFILLILYAIILIRTAWSSDDAQVTFRTVDNFLNGYGLTWNVTERVQASTHPLWMFLLSVLYVFTHELYFTTIFFSIVVSLIAVSIFAFKIAESYKVALVGIILMCVSKAFIDYSTSGLENPLTYLLLVVFFVVFFKTETSQKKIFFLFLVASFVMLNRLDMVLLISPSLIYEVIKFKNYKKAILAALLGGVPIIAWEIFSVIYYGFPFPNTAYAKLNTGVSKLQLIERGFCYFKNSFRIDSLTLITIITGCIVSFVMKVKRNKMVAIGIVLYLLYILKIGGDFMSGRFLTAPFLCAVILISLCRIRIPKKIGIAAIVVIVVSNLVSPYSSLRSGSDYPTYKKSVTDENGVSDERGFYYPLLGFLEVKEDKLVGKAAYKRFKVKEPEVMVISAIGGTGYHAGPHLYIVDTLALTEPFLARLPVPRDSGWRVGHYPRILPEGYFETVVSGENKIKNKALAEYYDKLSLIVSGKLFDKERLITIWDMNMGKYNYLIDQYLTEDPSYHKVIEKPKIEHGIFFKRTDPKAFIISEDFRRLRETK